MTNETKLRITINPNDLLNVSLSESYILEYLRYKASGTKGYAFPKEKNMVSDLNLPRITILRILKKLESKNKIRIEKEGRLNKYYVLDWGGHSKWKERSDKLLAGESVESLKNYKIENINQNNLDREARFEEHYQKQMPDSKLAKVSDAKDTEPLANRDSKEVILSPDGKPKKKKNMLII